MCACGRARPCTLAAKLAGLGYQTDVGSVDLQQGNFKAWAQPAWKFGRVTSALPSKHAQRVIGRPSNRE